MSSALWLALVLSAAPADPPLRLEVLVSPTFGMEVGIRDVASGRRALFLYDEALSERIGWEDSSVLKRIAGIFGRTAKLVLIDVPLTSVLGVVEHEVFGHGARARENGLGAQFVFTLPVPYVYLFKPQLPFSGYAEYFQSGRPDRDLPMTAGGIEAESFSAHFVALRTFRDGGRIHYAESMHYVESSLAYASRWFDGQLLGDGEGSSDVDSYALLLAQRFNRSGRASQIDLSQRLRRAYAASFLNPLLWTSVYDVLVDYLGRGERYSVVRQLTIGGVRLFPLTRFLLSPFGAEHTVEVMISTGRFTLDVSVRGVSTGLASAWGVGARLFRFELRREVELGASIDLWLQPELLPEYRNAYDGRTLPGVSGMVEATWRPLEHFGLVAQVGAKSRGYVMGQPITEGVFGFAGAAFFAGR